MGLYGIVVGSLVVWRVSHLLSVEAGPGGVFDRLRARTVGTFWGDLLGCIWCVSLWVSAPVGWWIGVDLRERVLLWPALSAGALLVQRVLGRDDAPAAWVEE